MLFSQWKYTAVSDSDTVVIPDGCRDILILEDAYSEARLELTDWDDSSRQVHISKGQQITGFRLCPGLSIDENDLFGLKAVASAVSKVIEYSAAENADSIHLVRELADYNVPLQSVARQAGVSTRTLQRQLKKLKLPKPEYWRLLSRARLAASELSGRAPLSDIAFSYGYSDQAHMTRDFSRWFRKTPAQLRQDPALLKLINQLGVGNWTAEQISIK